MRINHDRTAHLKTNPPASPATETKRIRQKSSPLCKVASAFPAMRIGVLVASIVGQKMPATSSVQTLMSLVWSLARLLLDWSSRLVIQDGLAAGSSDVWECAPRGR